MLYFPTDYDKENPLTKKKGQMRIIDSMIKKAQEEGNEEEVKHLEEQKTGVSEQKAYD